MAYSDELAFEHDLVETLTHKGWSSEILKNPTEKDLIDNWANILFETGMRYKPPCYCNAIMPWSRRQGIGPAFLKRHGLRRRTPVQKPAELPPPRDF